MFEAEKFLMQNPLEKKKEIPRRGFFTREPYFSTGSFSSSAFSFM